MISSYEVHVLRVPVLHENYELLKILFCSLPVQCKEVVLRNNEVSLKGGIILEGVV